MHIPIADLMDRLSICELKAKYHPDAVAEYRVLLEVYGGTRDAYLDQGIDLDPHFNALREINAEIWGYESALRQGKLGEYDTTSLKDIPHDKLLQLAAVGMQAINIRNVNMRRKQVCAIVCKVTNTGFPDIKVNHASQPV